MAMKPLKSHTTDQEGEKNVKCHTCRTLFYVEKVKKNMHVKKVTCFLADTFSKNVNFFQEAFFYEKFGNSK